MACDKWGVDIVGGDTTSSYTGLAISITCIGEARKEDIVYRNGAKETDLICVSGDLGAAYMGLQLLEREKASTTNRLMSCRRRLLKQKHKGDSQKLSALNAQLSTCNTRLRRQGIPLAATVEDRSPWRHHPEVARSRHPSHSHDGHQRRTVQRTDAHLQAESNVGCRIFEKQIPIDYQTAVMAEELNMNVTTCALNGGEDYELLFTVPIGDHEKIQQMDDIRLIGHITQASLGHVLVTRDDQEFELKAQGWTMEKSQ